MYRLEITTGNILELKPFKGQRDKAIKMLNKQQPDGKIDRLVLTNSFGKKMPVIASVIHGADHWYYIPEYKISS